MQVKALLLLCNVYIIIFGFNTKINVLVNLLFLTFYELLTIKLLAISFVHACVVWLVEAYI